MRLGLHSGALRPRAVGCAPACVRAVPTRPRPMRRGPAAPRARSQGSSAKLAEDRAAVVRAPGSESTFEGLPKDSGAIPVTTDVTSQQMQEHIDMVRSDFKYVFKDIMDRQHFEDNMFFSDPISRVTFFRGYQFEVQFLRYFLAPIFEVHDVKQRGENHIVVKWSWTMNFWWNRYNPLRNIWDPRLAFSGITILGYNPSSGKWNKHVDGWDNLSDEEFPSLEGFAFVLRQMLQVSKPPNRPTIEFNILKKYHEWEIRRYKPFVVVEAQDGSSEDAEAALRAYFSGGNSSQRQIEWPTPLYRASSGKVAAILPGFQDVEKAPRPSDKRLQVRDCKGDLFAVRIFGGSPSAAQVQEERQELSRLANEEGTKIADGEWLFARYNDKQWPLGPFRRNEVLLPINEATFDLWRGVKWDFVDRTVARKV